jgi:endoribonuclease Dicer
MTHCSYYANKATRSMERLEFLGDAVLDYIVTAFLVSKHQHLDQGQVFELNSYSKS